MSKASQTVADSESIAETGDIEKYTDQITKRQKDVFERLERKFGISIGFDEGRSNIIKINDSEVKIPLSIGEGKISERIEELVQSKRNQQAATKSSNTKEHSVGSEDDSSSGSGSSTSGTTNNTDTSGNSDSTSEKLSTLVELTPDFKADKSYNELGSLIQSSKPPRIIAGPSGIGKSYFADRHKNYLDADTLIAKEGLWPKKEGDMEFWFEDQELVKQVESKIMSFLERYLDENPTHNIVGAWIPDKYAKDAVIVLPDVKKWDERLKIRSKDKNDPHPHRERHAKELSDGYKRFINISNKSNIPTFSDLPFDQKEVKSSDEAVEEVSLEGDRPPSKSNVKSTTRRPFTLMEVSIPKSNQSILRDRP